MDIDKILIDYRTRDALPKAVLPLSLIEARHLWAFYDEVDGELRVPESRHQEYWDAAIGYLKQKQGISPCQCCWAMATARMEGDSDKFLIFF